jgi:hypothetical protein
MAGPSTRGLASNALLHDKLSQDQDTNLWARLFGIRHQKLILKTLRFEMLNILKPGVI